MAIATGSNAQFSYVTEVTAGTTPATPTFNKFGVINFGVALTKDTFTDPSIQSDRQTRFFVHGNKKIGGDISTNLMSCGASPTGNTLYDPFFESLFQSTWSTNVLKIGQTSKSFTVEKIIQDTTGAKNYFRYKGVQTTTLTVDIALNAAVSAKWSFAGLDEDPVATSIITGATYVDIPTAPQPVVHINSGNFFKEGGSATSLMTALSFTIDNAPDINYALGSPVANSITYSTAKITGTATYYFSDATMYNKFINETISSIEVKLSDGGRSYTFLFPKVKYGAATATIPNDKTIIVQMPFTALYDSVTGTTVQLTRGI